MKNKDVKDPAQIDQLLARGNYVVKEIETLYMLRKYRTLKKRYYADESDHELSKLSKKLESESSWAALLSINYDTVLLF